MVAYWSHYNSTVSNTVTEILHELRAHVTASDLLSTRLQQKLRPTYMIFDRCNKLRMWYHTGYRPVRCICHDWLWRGFR